MTMCLIDMSTLQDGECLARFAATRDERYFNEVVARYHKMVLTVCLRILGNLEDAEDAARSTFLALFMNRERLYIGLGAPRARTTRSEEPTRALPASQYGDR